MNVPAENGTRFGVDCFGAVGDGQTLNTAAIQAAIDDCAQAGGGTVYLPAGRYVTGSLFLRSDITLYLDAGAVLLGSERATDYPVVAHRWEGVSRETHAPLIGGTDVENVAIRGRGTIDGRGTTWWEMHRARTLAHPRPRLVSFGRSRNVLIEGCTLTNSPSWTIHPYECDNVTVDKVTIVNPPHSPNTDGINPESCRNVHIANCHIDVGDDCVTIKSGTEEEGRDRLAPCENIAVTNCTMVHGHGGVVIGSEMSGDVRNVVIANCVFVGTDRGIRLKSRRGRGGVVEDIRASNLVMTGVLCPFIMNLYYGPGAWGAERIADKSAWPVDAGTPRFRRIHFSHITARQVQYAAAFLYGLAEMFIEDVTFEDVAVSMALDAEAGNPAMAPGISAMQRAGFCARNVRGLRLRDVEVSGQVGPALTVEDAVEVEVNGGLTRTPDGTGPVIQMRNVVGAFVQGCRAGEGAFLHLEGEKTCGVVLRDIRGLGADAVHRSGEVPAGAVVT
jgi:polygalacturonase